MKLGEGINKRLDARREKLRAETPVAVEKLYKSGISGVTEVTPTTTDVAEEVARARQASGERFTFIFPTTGATRRALSDNKAEGKVARSIIKDSAGNYVLGWAPPESRKRTSSRA